MNTVIFYEHGNEESKERAEKLAEDNALKDGWQHVNTEDVVMPDALEIKYQPWDGWCVVGCQQEESGGIIQREVGRLIKEDIIRTALGQPIKTRIHKPKGEIINILFMAHGNLALNLWVSTDEPDHNYCNDLDNVDDDCKNQHCKHTVDETVRMHVELGAN